MARNGVISPGVGLVFLFLDRIFSVLSVVCSRDIAGIQNHVKNNGADFGEIRRRDPRGRSKDA